MKKLRGYSPIMSDNIVYEVRVDCQDQDYYVIVNCVIKLMAPPVYGQVWTVFGGCYISLH